MRILVIGTGSIGRRHIGNLQKLVRDPGFVFLRGGGRRDSLSDTLGAKVVATLDEALALAPALAVIANPSALHCEPLVAILRARVPVYVEKPVVARREQVEALERVLLDLPYPPVSLAGCNLRFLPSVDRMRNLLRSGAIGVPVRAHLEVGQWLPDWRRGQDYRSSYSADPGCGGGVILDLVHELDMARYLFGEFSSLHAAGGRYSGLEISSEDAAIVLLSRTQGPVVGVGLDYVARKPIRHYEIVGTEGTLEWDLIGRRLTRSHSSGSEDIDCGVSGFDTDQTYLSAMREMLHAIASDQPTTNSIAEGLLSVRLAIQANEMIRT